jgi:HYD1 signature containing ADP-ribosyltransferase
MTTLTLYHYTDEKAVRSIRQEGVIRMGISNRHGPGVYLTSMDPRKYTREQVAASNYHAGAAANIRRGRLDYQVELKMPQHKVQRVASHGHIYLYTSSTLWIGQYGHKILKGGMEHRMEQQQPLVQEPVAVKNHTSMSAMGRAVVVVAVGGYVVATTTWNRVWAPLIGTTALAVMWAAAAQLVQWVSLRRSQQEQRTIAILRALEAIVARECYNGTTTSDVTFAARRVGSADRVCIICCNKCDHCVSVLRGGVLWADEVNADGVQGSLVKHRSHHWWAEFVWTVVEWTIVMVGLSLLASVVFIRFRWPA